MFSESVSVEWFVGSCHLIYGLIERDSASIDHDDRLDSDFVLLRYMAIVGSDKGVEVHSFSISWHIVSFLSVNRHSNPLEKEGYLGKNNSVSMRMWKNASNQSLKASHTEWHWSPSAHSYRTSKFPVFIICPVYDEVRTRQLTISGFLKFKVCIIP